MGAKITEEEASVWITSYPKYEILNWNEGKQTCLLDKSRNVKFTMNFSQFKSVLSRYPERIFSPTKEEKNKKRESTNLKKYGTKFVSQNKEIRKKQVETCIEKYGNKCSLLSDDVKEKSKTSKILKYGSIEAFEKCRMDKFKESMIDKYSVDHPLKLEEFKEKQISTFVKRYGTSNPNKNEKIREKIKKTCLSRFGQTSNLKLKSNKQKELNTKFEKGQIFLFDGQTLSNLAEKHNCSYTHVWKNKDKLDSCGFFNNGKTIIENVVLDFLKNEIGLLFESGKKIKTDDKTDYRPDFYLPNQNLIIECDGLYWHSEKFKDKAFHKLKKDFYSLHNFNSLFFREDEIINKFYIVQSIIKNKLNLNERVFARKCQISTSDPSFFEENHLMGKGSGRIYCLKSGGETVAAIQVKWKNKKEKILEISRFCTKNGTSVVGGYSRLIRHVEKVEQPDKILTFVDLRYGSGEYLESLGFKKKSEYLSFQWTDFKKTYHRMKCPGNSGYEKGLCKIWDCGQRLYEKII